MNIGKPVVYCYFVLDTKKIEYNVLSISQHINVWLIFGRLQWYFNRKRQPENKTQTLQRIKVFISEMESDNKNCFIIGHGFYFLQFKKQLKLHNYTGKSRRYFRHGEIAEYRKN